jgi:putative ABC transport system permease protein
VHEGDGRSPSWRRYLSFWTSNRASEVDAELEFHIASRVEELTLEGLSPIEARQRALDEFGDYATVRGQVRSLDESDARRQSLIDKLSLIGSDVRYALRSLRKAPGFTAVIVITLTLGIGLNSTIFSLVNAYLFRPLRLPNAERLIVIGNTQPLLQQPHELPWRDLQAYRGLHAVFEDLVGLVSTTESLNEKDRTERIWVERTTGNYFSALHIPLALGRGYDEGASGLAEKVIVLSHEFWRRRFNADSLVIGRSVQISGAPYTIIGVGAPSFVGLAPMLRSDGWAPIDESPAGLAALLKPNGTWFNIIGLLRPHVTVPQAATALRARAKELQVEFPATNKDVEPVIVLETHARPVLAIAGPVPLMAAVLLGLTLMVLAVACANVASLLLARGTVRHREFALRSALGASRSRLAREALMEAAILSLAGSIGAIALALWSTARLSGIRMATDVPLLFDLSPDWRVLAFTLGAALLTILMAGLVPALRNAGAAPQDALVAGGRSATDRGQQRMRSIIVVGQIAVSVVVLISAGLLARSMQAAEGMSLGFTTDHLLMAQYDLEAPSFDSIRAKAFHRDLLMRARELPGVRSAALAARIPFGYSNVAQQIDADQKTRDLPDGGLLVFDNVVSTEYFRTAGPPIVHGREFTEADNAAAARVAVINEVLASRLWPGEDAIGKTFRIRSDSQEFRVVGIARGAQYMFLGEPPRPFFWKPLAQERRTQMFLEIATSGAPETLVLPVQKIFRELNPNVPIFEVRSMEEHLRNGRAMFAVRLGAVFAATFALLALTLAAVGVYGLVSYSVSHRTREIGIRIAVGATVTKVLTLVLRQALTLAGLGVVIGAVAALWATHVMSSLLFGVRSNDPLTFVVGALVFAGICALASWLPARRAASMDPVRALRAD